MLRWSVGQSGLLLVKIGVSSMCTIKRGRLFCASVKCCWHVQCCSAMQQLGLGHPSVGQTCHLVKIKPAEKALPSGHSKVCFPVTARMLSGGLLVFHPDVMCRVCASVFPQTWQSPCDAHGVCSSARGTQQWCPRCVWQCPWCQW